MKRLVYLALGAIVLAAIVSGCGGHKVEGVPGTVAVVNGRDISGDVYLSDLNRKMGEQALKNLIEREVLLSWAADEKVSPTSAQIDKDINMLKREMQYDVGVQSLGEAGLHAELEGRQARANLSKKMFKPTDKELEQQYDRMKSSYMHGPRKFVAVIINLDRKRVEEAAKKVKGGMDFDEAAQLYSVSRQPIKTWIDLDRKGLPAPLLTAVNETKIGSVSKIFSLGQTGTPTNFGILKVTKSEGKADKSLPRVKDEVTDELALRKITQDMRDPSFPYQKEVGEFDKAFTDKKKHAKIEIDIPQFRGVIQDFHNPPPSMPMMYGGPGRRTGPPPGPRPSPRPGPR